MARKQVARELERVNEQCWLTVTDVWGGLVEVQVLPPSADLKGAMVITLARYVAAGWNLEEYSWRSARVHKSRR